MFFLPQSRPPKKFFLCVLASLREKYLYRTPIPEAAKENNPSSFAP